MHLSKSLSLFILLFTLTVGCNSTKSIAGGDDPAVKLCAYQWDLTELRGKPVSTTERVKPYLLFEKGDEIRISGSVGCNRLAGSVLIDGSTIKFSPLITTKMACPDQDLEYQFSGVLEQVNAWEINDDMLVLKLGVKTAAKLRASEKN